MAALPASHSFAVGSLLSHVLRYKSATQQQLKCIGCSRVPLYCFDPILMIAAARDNF